MQQRGETLLEEIMAFCGRYDIAQTQFGSMAVHSPSLVARIRAGKPLRPRTVERIRKFMALGNPRPRSRFSNTARIYARAKAANMRMERAAEAQRDTDPLEQAKRVIRRAGFHCFEAAIVQPRHHGKFYLGARLVTEAELFEFARRKGWDG